MKTKNYQYKNLVYDVPSFSVSFVFIATFTHVGWDELHKRFVTDVICQPIWLPCLVFISSMERPQPVYNLAFLHLIQAYWPEQWKIKLAIKSCSLILTLCLAVQFQFLVKASDFHFQTFPNFFEYYLFAQVNTIKISSIFSVLDHFETGFCHFKPMLRQKLSRCHS